MLVTLLKLLGEVDNQENNDEEDEIETMTPTTTTVIFFLRQEALLIRVVVKLRAGEYPPLTLDPGAERHPVPSL